MSVLLPSSAQGASKSAAIKLADLDERSLVQLAVARDTEAFGELYSRHRDEVHRILHGLLRDFPADVDDVASQVFMTALEQITSYQDRGRPFASWLHILIRYRAMEHRNWRERRREDELAEPTSAAPDVMAQRGLNPEDEAILRLELRRLLRSLPARRRLAVVLRDWAGWSYEEIARALNTSRRNAEAAIVRGRRAAREAALGNEQLPDRSVCECGCGQPVADSANGSRRFATLECWRRVSNQRRRVGAAAGRAA